MLVHDALRERINNTTNKIACILDSIFLSLECSCQFVFMKDVAVMADLITFWMVMNGSCVQL